MARTAITSRAAVTSRSTRSLIPWTPAQLSNLVAWYDADVGTTIATGVSQWNDQSGKGHHLLQATGVNQPLLITNAVNGHAAIRFDGVNDSMVATFNINQPETITIVYKQLTISGFGTHDILYDGKTGGVLLAADTDDTVTYINAGASLFTSGFVANNVYGMLTSVYNGTAGRFVLDGTAAGGNVGTNNAGGFNLGSGNGVLGSPGRWANIEVAMVLIQSNAIGSDELNKLQAYLKDRFGI